MTDLPTKVATVHVRPRQGWSVVWVLLRQLIRHPRSMVEFSMWHER